MTLPVVPPRLSPFCSAKNDPTEKHYMPTRRSICPSHLPPNQWEWAQIALSFEYQRTLCTWWMGNWISQWQDVSWLRRFQRMYSSNCFLFVLSIQSVRGRLFKGKRSSSDRDTVLKNEFMALRRNVRKKKWSEFFICASILLLWFAHAGFRGVNSMRQSLSWEARQI